MKARFSDMQHPPLPRKEANSSKPSQLSRTASPPPQERYLLHTRTPYRKSPHPLVTMSAERVSPLPHWREPLPNLLKHCFAPDTVEAGKAFNISVGLSGSSDDQGMKIVKRLYSPGLEGPTEVESRTGSFFFKDLKFGPDVRGPRSIIFVLWIDGQESGDQGKTVEVLGQPEPSSESGAV